MRILLAGATGAVGKRLLPMLIAGGHHVVATTTTAGKMTGLQAAGAEAVVLDGLERDAVMRAVTAARPEVIVHQMTALASMRSLKRFDDEFALSNRLRTEGTRHLIDAARAVGVRRLVAQGYTGWPNIREGGRIKTEDDPLDPAPPVGMRRSLAAIRELESMVLGLSDTSDIVGIVLRYGSFYGPGTSIAPGGEIVELVRKRRFPIVGSGAGVWSFIHIDDAARATMAASERGPAGVYNVVDDDPAEVAVWLPELARAIGAKPPRRVPVWLGRFFVGEPGVSMMTRVRGASNAKARRVLDWQPLYASWRDGFRQMLRG